MCQLCNGNATAQKNMQCKKVAVEDEVWEMEKALRDEKKINLRTHKQPHPHTHTARQNANGNDDC